MFERRYSEVARYVLSGYRRHISSSSTPFNRPLQPLDRTTKFLSPKCSLIPIAEHGAQESGYFIGAYFHFLKIALHLAELVRCEWVFGRHR